MTVCVAVACGKLGEDVAVLDGSLMLAVDILHACNARDGIGQLSQCDTQLDHPNLLALYQISQLNSGHFQPARHHYSSRPL